MAEVVWWLLPGWHSPDSQAGTVCHQQPAQHRLARPQPYLWDMAYAASQTTLFMHHHVELGGSILTAAVAAATAHPPQARLHQGLCLWRGGTLVMACLPRPARWRLRPPPLPCPSRPRGRCELCPIQQLCPGKCRDPSRYRERSVRPTCGASGCQRLTVRVSTGSRLAITS